VIPTDMQALEGTQRALGERLGRGQQEAKQLQDQTALMHRRPGPVGPRGPPGGHPWLPDPSK